jgi:hypothetical protein
MSILLVPLDPLGDILSPREDDSQPLPLSEPATGESLHAHAGLMRPQPYLSSYPAATAAK